MDSARSRLDTELARRGLAPTRSQAENLVKLAKVKVNGQTIDKAGYLIKPADKIEIVASEQYVSRAAYKLASIADDFKLSFANKTVLDVGSSTGGFTDYALRHGATKVVAVDVGSDQMHPSLKADKRVELHEKTDIRYFQLSARPNIVVIDVSFISLRQILPAVAGLAGQKTEIVAMVKPQFEAGAADINKGVIKNSAIQRRILKDFEQWVRDKFIVTAKADSQVAGAKGNVERFYLLKKARQIS